MNESRRLKWAGNIARINESMRVCKILILSADRVIMLELSKTLQWTLSWVESMKFLVDNSFFKLHSDNLCMNISGPLFSRTFMGHNRKDDFNG